MKGTIKVTGVREVVGFIHQNSVYAGSPNRYNSCRLTTRKYEPKALYVEGIMDGVPVSFYSPTVVVTVTTGFLNHKTMKQNSWFDLVEGEMESARGAQMFDGGDTPNVAISTPAVITPKVRIGDELNISYSVMGSKLKRVKIL